LVDFSDIISGYSGNVGNLDLPYYDDRLYTVLISNQ